MKKAILLLMMSLNPDFVQAKNEVSKDSSCQAQADVSLKREGQKPLRTQDHEELMQRINALIDKAYYLGFALGAFSGIFAYLVIFSGLKWAFERRHP